jgi:hypothetical protein
MSKITKKDIEKLLSPLPKQLQVEFALYCAKDVFHFIKNKDQADTANLCIELTTRWLKGENVIENELLYAASYASASAAYADSAASYAAASAAYAHAASAAYAAHAASYAAASASSAAFYAKNEQQKLYEYYKYLLNMINNLSELERVIYDI